MGYTEMSSNDELVKSFLDGGMRAVALIRSARHSTHAIIPAAHPENFQFFYKHAGAVHSVKSEIYSILFNIAILIKCLQSSMADLITKAMQIPRQWHLQMHLGSTLVKTACQEFLATLENRGRILIEAYGANIYKLVK